MKTFGIIVAMEKEISLLKEIVSNYQEKRICNICFFEGNINDKKIIFTTSGIGKVNAGITTILMIEHFNPDLIINTGIAGGYNRNLKPLDVVLATKVLYSDVDMTAAAAGSYPMGQIDGMPKYFTPSYHLVKNLDSITLGTILTGDQFVYNYEKTNALVEEHFNNYDVVAFDMESGAISQTAYLNRIPFIIIRAISDIIGSTSAFDYNVFSTKAANLVTLKVIDLINNL